MFYKIKHFKFQNIIGVILLAIILTSCQNHNLRSYYFKVSDFKDSKVYTYVDRNDDENIQNIRLRYEIIDNDTLFYSETLDDFSRPKEVFVEKVDTNASKMIDYFLVNYNSTEKATKELSEIYKREVFSFEASNYPLIWKLKVTTDGQPIIFEKKRTYLNEVTTLTILGKKTKCLVFKDEYKLEDAITGSINNFYQYTYYASGLGMVRFERIFQDGFVFDYWLEEVN